jgi:hypothetical protein
MCEQAASVWRYADGRPDEQLSRLAVAATRALTDSIITSVLAREGRRRWCEFCYAMPDVAGTFAQFYPGARFVCLYRSCGDVIRAVLDASPWGLADPVLAPFTRAYPVSTVAALTAYWLAHTRSLLAFEAAHQQAVLRIRYEDLATAERQTEQALMSFLGVVSSDGDTALAPGTQDGPDTVPPVATADPPAGLIPPALLAQANELLVQLGYQVLPD